MYSFRVKLEYASGSVRYKRFDALTETQAINAATMRHKQAIKISGVEWPNEKSRFQIERIWFEGVSDDSPDTSYLGEYSNSPHATRFTIDRQEEGDMERNEYRYFIASFNYDNESPENQEKYARQDYQRMESLNRGDWCYLNVSAVAEIAVQHGSAKYPPMRTTLHKIRGGSCGGIESDCECEDILKDCLSELKTELEAFGMTKRQIDAACRDLTFEVSDR